jgi:hypothetical protein
LSALLVPGAAALLVPAPALLVPALLVPAAAALLVPALLVPAAAAALLEPAGTLLVPAPALPAAALPVPALPFPTLPGGKPSWQRVCHSCCESSSSWRLSFSRFLTWSASVRTVWTRHQTQQTMVSMSNSKQFQNKGTTLVHSLSALSHFSLSVLSTHQLTTVGRAKLTHLSARGYLDETACVLTHLKLVAEAVECLQRILLVDLAALAAPAALLLLAAWLDGHEGQVLVKVLVVINNVMRKRDQLRQKQTGRARHTVVLLQQRESINNSLLTHFGSALRLQVCAEAQDA